MNKQISFLLNTIFAVSLYSVAVVTNAVPSKIDEVMLFSEGAVITRVADISIDGGEQSLIIEGLPADIDTDSLRFEVIDKNVRVGQIATRKTQYAASQDQKIVELEQKILTQELLIKVQRDRAESAKLELKFLQSMSAAGTNEANSNSVMASPGSWGQALETIRLGSDRAFKTIRDTAIKISQLEGEYSALRRTLASKKQAQKTSTELIISLSAPTSSQTSARIQYHQENAYWQPVYEARLNSSTNKLVIAQKAVVNQNTDEDWSNVKLTLSTSEPTQQISAPRLESRFFTLADSSRAYKYGGAVSTSNSGVLEEVVVTAQKNTTSWSGTYALSFPVAGRISIGNDADQNQRYDLQSSEFDVDLVTQIAPVESSQAFLAARFVNTSNVPFYSADMLVFVDGVFSGEATMSSLLPGADITLPMGQDPRIEVRLIDVGGKDNEKGIINKQIVEEVDLVFEIINRRPSSANIEVRAIFPVAKHKSLKIKVGDKTTPPTNKNDQDKTGVALWQKNLEPNEEWKINYKVSMAYPANRELTESYE